MPINCNSIFQYADESRESQRSVPCSRSQGCKNAGFKCETPKTQAVNCFLKLNGKGEVLNVETVYC